MFIDFILIGLSIGMVYALVALGISLVYSGLDIVHFAHGEMYMLGAFVGLFAYSELNLAYPFAFILAQFVNCMRHLVTAAARQARSLAPGARPTRWNQLR